MSIGRQRCMPEERGAAYRVLVDGMPVDGMPEILLVAASPVRIRASGFRVGASGG